jgi:hypothetical protein
MRFEVEAGGRRFEVEAPSLAVARAALTGTQPPADEAAPEQPPAREPLSWAEWARGLGRQALQGATFNFGDELESLVPSLRNEGEDRDAALARIRRENEEFARQNPWMSAGATLAGGVVPFVGPLGRLTGLRNAARWAGGGGLTAGATGRALGPTRSMLGTIGRSATFGGALGTAAGVGAGEGYLQDRSEGGGTGALWGTAIGAAIPPVAKVGGAVLDIGARTIAPQTYQRLRQAMTPRGERPPPPPEGGVVFVQNPSPEIADATEGALQLAEQQLWRAGGSRADVERALAGFTDDTVPGGIANARRVFGSGRGPDVVAPIDILPGMARMAGSAIRQYPENQLPASSFISGRQTGITPIGADAAELASRGIPTAERHAGPLTAAQSRKLYGTDFGAGEGNIVSRGQRQRAAEHLRRTFTVLDGEHHGIASTMRGSEDDLVNAARAGAGPLYDQTYHLGRGVDTSTVTMPVLGRWDVRWEARFPEVGRELRRLRQLLESRKGQPVEIEQFDKAKQYLDERIDHFMKAPEGRNRTIGGQLIALKNDLIAALEPLPNGIADSYAAARGLFESQMWARDIIRRGSTAFEKGTDAAEWLDWYGGLTPYGQMLARAASVWGVEGKSVATDLARDVTGVFRTPQAEQLIPGIIERSRSVGPGGRINEGIPGAMTDRNLRFGRYVNIEAEMPRTRDVILGGSSTMRNAQDDIALAGLEALQQTQSFLQMFQNSQSLWGFGQAILQKIIDRSFGFSADRARALTRMLFTANEVDRAEFLRRLLAIMPADRTARFNELMTRINQRFAAPGISAGSGALAEPPAAQPPGPGYV